MNYIRSRTTLGTSPDAYNIFISLSNIRGMDQNNVDTTGTLHYPPSLCGLPCWTFTFIDAKSVSFKGFGSKVRCFDHGGVKGHTANSHSGNPR